MPTKTKVPRKYYDDRDSVNACFLCRKPRYKLKYQVDHFDFPFSFSECECGLIKQTPMPNQKFFDWFFNSDVFFSSKKTAKGHVWGYYDYFRDEPDRMATSKWRYSHIFPLLKTKKPLKILKIGPATGTFLHVAKEHGHKVLGCDVSREFIGFAKSNYGVKIDQGRFEVLPYKKHQFDAVFLFNVIENVPNQDEFLKAINRVLKPGGWFVLNYVDIESNLIARFQGSKYFLYRPPICYIFSTKVITRVLNQYGFEIRHSLKDIRYLSMAKIFSLLNWAMLVKLVNKLSLDRVSFPMYAYPSSIMIAQKRP